MVDVLEIIEEVCKEFYFTKLWSVFGDRGVEAAFAIMRTAKSLYKHVEPERVKGSVVIYCDVTDLPIHSNLLPGITTDFATLANANITELVLEVKPDGTVFRRPALAESIEQLSSHAVIYLWRCGAEEFSAGSHRMPVVKLDKAAKSQFAVPTLATLREALSRYAAESVRESTCLILGGVWIDEARLFFKAKPEATMRDSLTQFLRNRIGADHDVLPESNVDKSHPVDIRVAPRLANNRMMLIEIKWLGCSVADDGHITARHGPPRAQAGADQLAQYIEDQRRFAPTRVIHGYLVIIDGRRRNLNEGAKAIASSDGLYFEDEELVFDPAYHEIRHDFDPPYRMFARPMCLG